MNTRAGNRRYVRIRTDHNLMYNVGVYRIRMIFVCSHIYDIVINPGQTAQIETESFGIPCLGRMEQHG